MLLCNECGRLHCPGAALRKSLGLTQSLPCGSCPAPSILCVSFHGEAARSPQEDGDVGRPPPHIPPVGKRDLYIKETYKRDLCELFLELLHR